MPAHRFFAHFAAIDWSGAAVERPGGIAVAICEAGGGAPKLVRGHARWSRGEIVAWLRGEMPPDTLVGLDLGVSLPFADCGAFFPGWDASPADAQALWQMVETICAGDPHLAVSSFVDHPEVARYFRRHGGRRGDRFGEHPQGRFRVTEGAQAQRLGCRPYSNLNLVGAAQVGKSSLTGMRVLYRIEGMLPIWPFDPVPSGGSLVVEIYTAIAAIAAGRTAARTKMASWDALDNLLASPAIASAPLDRAGLAGVGFDDHKADALLTAAWLRAAHSAPTLWNPQGLNDVRHTEGWTFGVP